MQAQCSDLFWSENLFYVPTDTLTDETNENEQPKSMTQNIFSMFGLSKSKQSNNNQKNVKPKVTEPQDIRNLPRNSNTNINDSSDVYGTVSDANFNNNHNDDDLSDL